jgi:hypothetical protein
MGDPRTLVTIYLLFCSLVFYLIPNQNEREIYTVIE